MKFSSELEQWRVKDGFSRTPHGKPYGAFVIPYKSFKLCVVACNAGDTQSPIDLWEHVSVSLLNRCPNWPEMCFVKDLFWGEDETVVQFHPKKSEYVNNHPYVLHLWKHRDNEHELPPKVMV